jgi:hypothetical protein
MTATWYDTASAAFALRSVLLHVKSVRKEWTGAGERIYACINPKAQNA